MFPKGWLKSRPIQILKKEMTHVSSAFLSVNVNAKKLHNIKLAKQCNHNNNKLEMKRGLLE